MGDIQLLRWCYTWVFNAWDKTQEVGGKTWLIIREQQMNMNMKTYRGDKERYLAAYACRMKIRGKEWNKQDIFIARIVAFYWRVKV